MKLSDLPAINRLVEECQRLERLKNSGDGTYLVKSLPKPPDVTSPFAPRINPNPGPDDWVFLSPEETADYIDVLLQERRASLREYGVEAE